MTPSYFAVAWSLRGRMIYIGKSYPGLQYVTEFAEELVKGRLKGMTHVSVQDANNQTVWSENVETEPTP